jgi:undecaprenyl-diphosphatase
VPLVRALASGWGSLTRRHPWTAALVPGLLLVLLGLSVFLATLDSVQERDDLMVVDAPVLAWLARNRNRLGDVLLHAVTLVSGPIVLPVLVASAAVLWGLRRRQWWRPFLLLASMLGAGLVALAVKRGVARPRPPLDAQYIPGAETTFSFPSGHTIVTATLCLVAGYLVWSRHATPAGFVLWWAATGAVTAAVGLSRLYLGYHFVTDVVGAVGLAVAVLGVVVTVDRYRALRTGGRLPPVEPARP